MIDAVLDPEPTVEADRGVQDAPGSASAGRVPRSPPTSWSATCSRWSRPRNGRCASRRWTPCSAGSSRLKRDELRIDARPDDGAVLGAYATRRRGSGARPYQTVLSAIDPIEARCDCPDFVKNSLGICKHVLIVLEHLYSQAPAPAAGAQGAGIRSRGQSPPGLLWDPIRPLTGAGDWLERVAWAAASEANGARARADGPGPEVVPARRQWGPRPEANRSATIPRAAWPWSRTCSSSSPRAAGPTGTTRRCGPCWPPSASGSKAVVKQALTPAELQRGLQGPEADALSLSARGRRAVPGARAACSWPTTWGWARPRRRSPADRHPLAHPADPPRPDHRPGQPQAPVGPRMGQLLRPADRGHRRLARRAPGALRGEPVRASSSSTTSN